jgi:hypothetical protein
MPAGKAIALAAMPTAVLMGMGFTPTLALADSPSPSASNSLTAEEYEACVAALEKGGKQDGPTDPAPSPSASASATEDAGDGRGDGGARPAPSSSGTTGAGPSASPSSQVSSPDSGSDDETGESGAGDAAGQDSRAVPASSSPSPSPSQDGGLLEDIGARIEDLVPGGASSSSGPAPAASASSSGGAPKDPTGAAGDGAAGEPEKDAPDPDPSAPAGGARDGGTASGAAGETGRAEEEETAQTGEADPATTSPAPDPSSSASADPEDCPIATDAEGGVDNALLLPDDPWYLEASSLTLKGADYQGIVEVKTANGTTKRVLKYVISDGTDIGDLHQIVKDRGSGKTYHVQAAKGSTSTIRDGKTIMYTESISGNLLGLIPVTFDPEHPPPLNIPLIYFTNVKVTQAGQFGGTLTIPGLHQTITD